MAKNIYKVKIFLVLNMILVSINIPTFCFSPSKIFLQLLLPIKFSITTFGPYFIVSFYIFLMKLCSNM